MRAAIIIDGIVDNIINADQEFLDASNQEYVLLTYNLKGKIGDIYADGVFTTPAPIPEDYTVLRKRAYPSDGDQLDMLYHAMADGVLPMVPEWFDTIKAVKDKYPKPV